MICSVHALYHNGSWISAKTNNAHKSARIQCDKHIGFLESTQYVCDWLTSSRLQFHVDGCTFVKHYDNPIFMIGDSIMAQLYLVPQQRGCRTYVRNDFLTEVVPAGDNTSQPNLISFYDRTVPPNISVVVANSGSHYNWLKAGSFFEKSYVHMLRQLHAFSLTRPHVKFVWLPLSTIKAQSRQASLSVLRKKQLPGAAIRIMPLFFKNINRTGRMF